MAIDDVLRRLRLPLSTERPLAILHAGGNDPARQRQGEAAGVDLIEADIWRYRGGIEVRHAKRGAALPIIPAGWGSGGTRLRLEQVLEDAAASTAVMWDLKGEDPRLGTELVALLRRLRPNEPILACTRFWPILEAAAADPLVVPIYSGGDEQELGAIWPKLERLERPTVSIQRRLLTPKLVRAFAAVGVGVICWLVNTEADWRELASWGVVGCTSDNLDLLRRAAADDADLRPGDSRDERTTS